MVHFMTTISDHSMIVAITGGIACGKSEVGKFFLKNNFNFFDADKIANKYLEIGTPTYEKIKGRFSKNILNDKGCISKKKLGELAFSNDEEIKFLNDLIHPLVIHEIKNWIKHCRKNKICGAAEIPLLYECNLENLDWDKIIVVHAKKKIVVKRLQGRGLSKKEAFKRIQLQMNLKEKCSKNNILLDGNKNIEHLNKSVSNLFTNWIYERK